MPLCAGCPLTPAPFFILLAMLRGLMHINEHINFYYKNQKTVVTSPAFIQFITRIFNVFQ